MMQPEVRCVEFVEQVTEWMEDGLDDDERLLVEEHLAVCPNCTRYLDQMRAALAVLRATGEELVGSPPPATRSLLLEELRRRRS